MNKRKRKAFFQRIAEKHYSRMQFHHGVLRQQYIEQLKGGSSLEASEWLDLLLADHHDLMGHVAAAAEIDNPSKGSHTEAWKTPAVIIWIRKLALENPDKEGYVLHDYIGAELIDWAGGPDLNTEDGLVDGELLASLLAIEPLSLRRSVERALTDKPEGKTGKPEGGKVSPTVL